MNKEKESKWIELEWGYAQALISGNKSARINYLSFFITLNIAIYTALYLLNKWEEIHEIGILLSFSLLLINLI